MKYEKPEVEVVKFEQVGFMTASGGFASADDYLKFLKDNGTITMNGQSLNSAIHCNTFGDGGTTYVTPEGYKFIKKGKNWHYDGQV